jgi:hypothetical protein
MSLDCYHERIVISTNAILILIHGIQFVAFVSTIHVSTAGTFNAYMFQLQFLYIREGWLKNFATQNFAKFCKYFAKFHDYFAKLCAQNFALISLQTILEPHYMRGESLLCDTVLFVCPVCAIANLMYRSFPFITILITLWYIQRVHRMCNVPYFPRIFFLSEIVTKLNANIQQNMRSELALFLLKSHQQWLRIYQEKNDCVDVCCVDFTLFSMHCSKAFCRGLKEL